MKSDGNDGSAVVSDGATAPSSGRPAQQPLPRKRTSTLQGAATVSAEDVPTLSTSADAPPSLEALDSAIGFAQPGAVSPRAASDSSSRALPDARAGAPLSAPAAPPRPRSTSAPPGGAAPASSSPTPPPRPLSALADGPPAIPDIDGPGNAGSTRDSSTPGGGNTRRRSRRTLKIPDDAVPSTTPAPPAVASAPAPATPPSAAPVTPPPVSSTLPAVLAPERFVADDSIGVIRPMMILDIGDPTPAGPVAAAVAATPISTPPAAPIAAPAPPPAPADVETTMPAAPSPIAAARAASPMPPRPDAAAPVGLENTMPSGPSPLRAQATAPVSVAVVEAPADEVDALEEIEPERESGPPSDQQRLTAREGRQRDAAAAEARRPEVDALEEIEPAELDGDRISGDEIDVDRAITEEIPVVMDVEPEQPKRPPPPPKRADGAPVSVSAPPSSQATAPASAPQSAPTSSQAPPASAPTSKPATSKPAPPTSKAESKKRPWWDEIFSEDFIRTMDTAKPSYIQREVNFIEESLGVEKGAVVLDLACGTGLHAVELASRGYSVVGFDLSLAMLARASDEAQDRGQKLNFLQGDMREMAFEEMFDGIYCWSTSFGYFDEEKNLEVLARAHRALRHGGMLLIDIVNRDFIAPRQPSLVWFEGDGCVCMDEMHVDFFTSRLKVKRTVMFEDGRTREVDYSIRLYNLHEVGKMMHDCGFRVVQVTGQPAHPGVFFGSESPRIIVLAERAD